MQDEKEDKIIFLVKSIEDEYVTGCDIPVHYRHVMGESSKIEEGLKKWGGVDDPTDWIETAKKALEKDEEGRFQIGAFTVFVLPKSMVALHTCQCPFVVIQDNEVIDVDEYWYTPFKELLGNSYNCVPMERFEPNVTIPGKQSFGYSDYGLFLKCRPQDEPSGNALIAVKTYNCTYNV